MRSRIAVKISAIALAAPLALAAQQANPGMAVMPFNNGGSYGQDSENFEALEVGLQQMLITEFAANPGLRVVDRSRLNQLISEQDLGASGRVDANTAARVGRLVGARYMVLGGFVDFYGDMRIDARIVDVETGEIVRTERINKRREELYSMVTDLAIGITEGLNLPPLPRQVREARQSREVPAEAIQLYTRGILYRDRGYDARAAELFRNAIEVYPEYEEATQALQQVQS